MIKLKFSKEHLLEKNLQYFLQSELNDKKLNNDFSAHQL